MVEISTILLGAVLTFGFLWGGIGLATIAWRGCGPHRWWGLSAAVLCFGIAIWATWFIIARFNGWGM
jgi:hypothetical protein